MQDTSQVTSLDALQGQSSNEGGTNTATILRSKDLDGVLSLGVGLLGPVEDLSQSLGATGLEVRVLVKYRTVSTNVARLVVLLLADGGHTAGRQTSGTGANELGQAADQLELGGRAGDVETLEEAVERLLEVLPRIPASC